MDVAFEVVQSLVALGGFVLGGAALLYSRRHDHGVNGYGPSRPGHPDSTPTTAHFEVEPAVAPAVAADLKARGPITRSRKPEPKVAAVCECGVPGKACRIHGLPR